ncbi:MAG TPA: radical SAM protein [Thermodesulfobacteriota bacterium]|nr:radical SAM protein [Thermodesulfobacteriota bacterium]
MTTNPVGIKNGRPSYKVFIDSSDMGCKPNAIGTSQVANYVRQNGHATTTDISEADFIVVNTCGFDVRHEVLSRDIIRDHFKNKKPGAQVISIGCLNVINKTMLEEAFPGLNIVTDFTVLDRKLSADKPYEAEKGAFFDESIFDFVTEKYPKLSLRKPALFGIRFLRWMFHNSTSPRIAELHLSQIVEEIDRSNKVYVLIGRGCAGNCSYCIIKKAQGNPKSRAIEDIIDDIRKVYSKGKVLCLTADDCASYGLDTGTSLFALVERISEEFPGIRLDFGYLNPFLMEKYSEEYLEMFKKSRINEVNIPLQSGSNRILDLMNRRYKAENVLHLIGKIKQVSPGTMIWTHVIFGFPTESWGDFYKTLKALKHFHFYYTFPYAQREGTKSAGLKETNSRFICILRANIAYAALTLRVLSHILVPIVFRKRRSSAEVSTTRTPPGRL